jgi:hypothetical protein
MIDKPAPDRVPHEMSYIMNAIAPKWNTPFGVNDGHGVFTYAGYAGGDLKDISNSTVTNPADVIMLIDGKQEIVGKYWGCPWSLTTEGDFCYDWWNFSSVISFDWEVYTFALALPTDSYYKAWHKHGAGANSIFTDGHSKVVKTGEVTQAKRWITNAP